MKLNVLKAVWNTQEGYVFVPRRKDGVWDEGRAFKYPSEWDAVKARLTQSAADNWDTYWCPMVFSKPKRLKENAINKIGILWADLDEVDPKLLGNLRPSIAWASSDNRYQGLWSLDSRHDIDTVEEVNKNLTYHIGADKGGWDVTQVLRVPGSANYKYNPPQQGTFLWVDKSIYVLEKVAEQVKNATTSQEDISAESGAIQQLLETWNVSSRTRDLLLTTEAEVEVGERSDRLWEIETSLVEAGVPLLDIVSAIKECAWNKFKGRRNEAEQIYGEVMKAEKHVKSKARTENVIPIEERMKDDMWAIPFDKFVSTHIDPPKWLIDGIWQSGTYGMIAGEPKTYKSVQATDLALSVASGRPYLGHFPVTLTGAVLYIQEENNPQTVQDRIFKIAYAKGLLTSTGDGWALADDLPMYFSNNYGINLTDVASRELIEETIKKIKPVLIILDPLYMMLGQVDENSAKEVGDVLRWLTYLRNEYGVALLLCHHYNKGGLNTRGGQRVRGSSAFHAWVESALYVKSTPELYTVKLEREFRAYPAVGEITLKVEMGAPNELYYRTTVQSDSTASAATHNLKREEIMSILAVTHRTFDELKTLSNMSRRELQDMLKELEMDGIVVKDDSTGTVGGRSKKTVYMLSGNKFQNERSDDERDKDDDDTV